MSEMDQMDQIRLLQSLLLKYEKQCNETSNLLKLSFYLQQLNEIQQQIEENHLNTMDSYKFDSININNMIQEILSFIPIEYHEILKFKNWSNCPEELYLQNQIGLLSRDKTIGWEIPPDKIFHVRSNAYKTSNIKILSESPLFHLRGVQMIRTKNLCGNIATKSWSAYPKYPQDNEWLIINYMVPGTYNVQLICYYSASYETLVFLNSMRCENFDINSTSGWRKSIAKFWMVDKEYCDKRFKLIPTMLEGPWLVRQSVGSKPCLLGLRLKLQYTRADRYFEIGINIESSVIATQVLKLVSQIMII